VSAPTVGRCRNLRGSFGSRGIASSRCGSAVRTHRTPDIPWPSETLPMRYIPKSARTAHDVYGGSPPAAWLTTNTDPALPRLSYLMLWISQILSTGTKSTRQEHNQRHLQPRTTGEFR